MKSASGGDSGSRQSLTPRSAMTLFRAERSVRHNRSPAPADAGRDEPLGRRAKDQERAAQVPTAACQLAQVIRRRLAHRRIGLRSAAVLSFWPAASADR